MPLLNRRQLCSPTAKPQLVLTTNFEFYNVQRSFVQKVSVFQWLLEISFEVWIMENTVLLFRNFSVTILLSEVKENFNKKGFNHFINRGEIVLTKTKRSSADW